MAHHNFDPKESSVLRRLVAEAAGLGATGEYPHGKYGERDEGEIQFAVAADREKQVVIIDFGKPVHSLGMTGDEAQGLADMLVKKAFELRGIV